MRFLDTAIVTDVISIFSNQTYVRWRAFIRSELFHLQTINIKLFEKEEIHNKEEAATVTTNSFD